MPVIDVHETSKTSASITNEGRTAYRRFSVLLDGSDDVARAPILARQANVAGVRIPQIGDSHPGDIFMRVVEVDPGEARGQGAAILFDVTVRYEARNTGTGDGSGVGQDSPLDQPERHTVSFRSVREAVDHDASGNPIMNMVEESLNPPIQSEFFDYVHTIRRNEASEPKNIENLNGSVNKEDVVIGGKRIPAGQARVYIVGDKQIEGNWDYWAVTITVVARRRLVAGTAYLYDGKRWNAVQAGEPKYTWYRRMLNRGFRTKTVTGDGTIHYRELLDDQDNPLTEPANLGTPRADGLVDILTNTEDAVWLLFPDPAAPVQSWKSLSLK